MTGECSCSRHEGFDPDAWWLMSRMVEAGSDLRRLGEHPVTGASTGRGHLDANMMHLLAHRLLDAGVVVPSLAGHES